MLKAVQNQNDRHDLREIDYLAWRVTRAQKASRRNAVNRIITSRPQIWGESRH